MCRVWGPRSPGVPRGDTDLERPALPHLRPSGVPGRTDDTAPTPSSGCPSLWKNSCTGRPGQGPGASGHRRSPQPPHAALCEAGVSAACGRPEAGGKPSEAPGRAQAPPPPGAPCPSSLHKPPNLNVGPGLEPAGYFPENNPFPDSLWRRKGRQTLPRVLPAPSVRPALLCPGPRPWRLPLHPPPSRRVPAPSLSLSHCLLSHIRERNQGREDLGWQPLKFTIMKLQF